MFPQLISPSRSCGVLYRAAVYVYHITLQVYPWEEAAQDLSGFL